MLKKTQNLVQPECRILIQKGFSEDIKGYLSYSLEPLGFGAFAQGAMVGGGGKGKRAQTPSFLHIKKTKFIQATDPVGFVNCPVPNEAAPKSLPL